MSAKNEPDRDDAGREFVITREFAAPRELVFKAWTDPQLLKRWWGPRGFENPVCQWDAKPGNDIYVVMRAPNGAEFPMGGQFREVAPPERLVFTSGALDEKRNLLFEFLHTVTFAERSGKTLLTIRSQVTKTTPGAGKYIGGFEQGMSQSLERLAKSLAGAHEPLVLERTFNVPADRVWKAITNKEEINQWSFQIKEFKPEVGFEFEFYAEKDDVKYCHLCKITEVIPGKKLAHSWRYEGHEGDSLVTYELFAEGDKTRVRLTHEGLETFPKTPDYARLNFMEGWTQLFGTRLKEFVERTTV